ncbi:hypothetical protein ACIBTV_27610 [Micromonospora sp. NPDC049366]|uniref:hypothetical protein n=1 Tax=Micromonospora sp. NPDC049366 TaxID=3364271 RepID=UPI0037B7A7B0
MTTTGMSRRQAAREVAHANLRAQGREKLPVTWLGTGGHDDPADDGWQSHMWSHPAYAAGGTYLAGTLIDHALNAGLVDALGPVQPGLVVATAAAGVGLAAGAAGFFATAGQRFTDWARAFCTFGPVAAGAWLAGVAVSSPYNVPALATAAAGTAAAMLGYRRMRDEQDRHELAFVSRFAPPPVAPAAAVGEPPRRPAPSVVEDLDPDLRRWTAAFEKVGLKGCAARKKVDTPAGYAILVRFPDSGRHGLQQVDGKLEALERSLGMLKDCLEVDVAIDPATGRELADRCWIHVDVADILSQLLPMPEGHEPTTINEAFRIGTYMDGKPMTLRLREISALIIGVRGRGKTNLFHVIVHALSRCIDVVLWAIDLKGGRAVKPWLAPWLSGKAARPVFDWVATTRMEAALMLHAANALIAHRGNASAGGSKMEPSEAHPAVLVLCDEIAALVGKHSGPTMSNDWTNPTANQMSAKLTLGVQLGRSECVDFVLFSQRATVSMVGGGDLKSQCEMRIGLGVTNAGDASSVFQNDSVNARKLRRLKHKRTRGACLVENGEDPNHLAGKTYYYGDGDDMTARIERAAIAHAMYPADLPLVEQQAIDDALRHLTAPRDKRTKEIIGEGLFGYGVGSDGAAAERWSMARAEHLYTDGLPDAWTDDEPSDGEHLGGGDTAGGAATPRPGGGGVATATRPTATARPETAPLPTQRGHLRAVPDPTTEDTTSRAGDGDSGGSRYYTRRRDRRTEGEHGQGPGDTPIAATDIDEMVKGFVDYLASLPDGQEPQLADDTAEELTRYDLMIKVIKDAGDRGATPTPIGERMRELGLYWAARTDIYPALRKALADGVIVQPNGKGGRYYHRDHSPTRPAQ